MVLAVSRTCSGDEILLSHHFIRPAVLLGCPGPALYLQFQRSARHGPHIHHPSFVHPAACLRAGAGVNHSADGRAVREVLGGGGVQSGRSFPNGSDLAETVDSGRRKCGSGNICCLEAGGQVRGQSGKSSPAISASISAMVGRLPWNSSGLLQVAFDFLQGGGIGLRQVGQRWRGGESGTLAGPPAGES